MGKLRQRAHYGVLSRERRERRLIDEYGMAFCDRYLGNAAAPVLSKKDPALADYRFRTRQVVR